MLAMAVICRRLAPYLLALAPEAPRSRTGLWLAFLPALLAIPLIVPFRVPNHPVEILLPPGADALIAGAWLWAMSSLATPAVPTAAPGSTRLLWIGLLALLAFFQLVLRPGITF
jgi:hypothetical protein